MGKKKKIEKRLFWVCYSTGTYDILVFLNSRIHFKEKDTHSHAAPDAHGAGRHGGLGRRSGVTGSAGSGRVERNWAGNVEYNGARALPF